jgi:hypothetical protein
VDAIALRRLLDVAIAIADKTASGRVPVMVHAFGDGKPLRLTPEKNAAGESSAFLLMPLAMPKAQS